MSTTNGSGTVTAFGRGEIPRPPPRVEELAEGCVRFVERAVGVKLDYTLETLPLLDHYIEQARASALAKPEGSEAVLALVAHSLGAYFGEVVRRRHASWWRAEADDPTAWRIELEEAYLAFSPVELLADALLRRDDAEDGGFSRLELEDRDRDAVAQRLAELPAVSEQEFYAPSTRLEVIDIAVEEIRSRRIAEGEDASAALQPDDYGED